MISLQRLARDIEEIARCSQTPSTVGYSRPTFSEAWRAACDYVVDQAREVGCHSQVDAAGNLHIRNSHLAADRPCWLSGSHLDSVPTGGRFDGVVGVVVPLEVLRVCPTAPLELMIFAEEEGTTFSMGMLGSRAWTGDLDARQLAELRNRDGDNYLQAGSRHGVNPERLLVDGCQRSRYRGFVEVHIEQGAGMWKAGTPVAVVTSIHGRQQYLVTVTGENNHAGCTRMQDRKDALAAAAEMVLGLETLAREIDARSDHTVITVGRMIVEPNAFNVIPGRVTFSVDLRARDDETLAQGNRELSSLLQKIANQRRVQVEWQPTESMSPIPLDPGICERFRAAAGGLGMALPDVASAALHDAAVLAPHLPTAMLFVASRDGISHDPREFSQIEDIALAAQILQEFVMYTSHDG